MSTNSDMRRLMTLLESPMMTPATMPGVPGGAAPNAPLTGMLDIKGLAQLLPDVTDPNRFVTAMAKVRSGRINSLTLQERGQLAAAFISILRDDRDVTLKVMRKLAMVKAKGVI